MVSQIIAAQGTNGTNIEYIAKLADYFRNNVPEETDSHLFTLDKMIKESLDGKKNDSTSREL